MYKHTKEKSNNIYTILNATLSSIKSVIPVQSQIKKPKLLKDDF